MATPPLHKIFYGSCLDSPWICLPNMMTVILTILAFWH